MNAPAEREQKTLADIYRDTGLSDAQVRMLVRTLRLTERREGVQRDISLVINHVAPRVLARERAEKARLAPTGYAAPCDPTSLKGRHEPVVYFLENGSRIKVGVTTNLRSRVSSLSLRMTDVRLTLYGNRELEGLLHERFACERVGNTEWFDTSPRMLEYIASKTRSLPPDPFA